VLAYAAGAKDEKQSVDEKIATALQQLRLDWWLFPVQKFNTKRKIIIIKE